MSISFANAEKKEFHFRDADFGMTKQQVKDSEKEKPKTEDDDSLLYTDRLLGFEVVVIYMFVDNKFFLGQYIFEQEYTNENRYIEDFRKIKSALKEKYGNPDIGSGASEARWSQTFYKDRPEKHGMALIRGEVEYLCLWSEHYKPDSSKSGANQTYLIGLSLEGNDFEITSFSLSYSDKSLYELYVKKKKEKEDSKL